MRSSRHHGVKCLGLKWVSLRVLVAVSWATRVWALPFLTGRCWPPQSRHQRRPKTSGDWGRQRVKQTRRWLPRRLLVLVVDGGFAECYKLVVFRYACCIRNLREEAVDGYHSGTVPLLS